MEPKNKEKLKITINSDRELNKDDLKKIQEDLKEEFNAIVEGENLDPVSSDQESAANGININKNLGSE